ncbi:hypothetical protein WMY93_027569 [Mugilogobius chulae]|uniref:Uncharacterized protein n=1 Tax=Mugilogobius chulae TaxID=88201 RepID=A0AAW0MV07_9GOBI
MSVSTEDLPDKHKDHDGTTKELTTSQELPKLDGSEATDAHQIDVKDEMDVRPQTLETKSEVVRLTKAGPVKTKDEVKPLVSDGDTKIPKDNVEIPKDKMDVRPQKLDIKSSEAVSGKTVETKDEVKPLVSDDDTKMPKDIVEIQKRTGLRHQILRQRRQSKKKSN